MLITLTCREDFNKLELDPSMDGCRFLIAGVNYKLLVCYDIGVSGPDYILVKG